MCFRDKKEFLFFNINNLVLIKIFSKVKGGAFTDFYLKFLKNKNFTINDRKKIHRL